MRQSLHIKLNMSTTFNHVSKFVQLELFSFTLCKT